MDKALCVGINSYKESALRGCVNDVINMANFLVNDLGFSRDSVRLLVDERATTQGILERLEWLTSDVKAGDRILFQYSGHGISVANRDKKGEIDAKSEGVCPINFDWSPENMIIDTQFVEIFSRMPAGVKFNWLSDSCFSGDLSKIMLPTDVLIKTYPVPADVAWRNSVARENGITSEFKGMVNNELEVGFMSGCEDHQTSADTVIDGKPGGAFTCMFLKCIKENKSLSMIELGKKVHERLEKASFEQNPSVEGTRSNMPFLE